MILFKQLRYKNFLSTGDSFTEVDFIKNKTTLVVGSNGAGKSTMLDALSFALFGKSHRSINKLQLVNSINNKRTLVEVEFSVNSAQYKIVRGLKPHKFEIWKDGVLFNQNSHTKEYQKILEQNIIKLNHKTFHQVVVLGSSSFIPFMQLSAHHRREVIEDLLDINVFSKMNMLLKEKISLLKDEVRVKTHERDIIQTKVQAAKRHIRDLKTLGLEERNKKLEKIKLYEVELKGLHESVSVQRQKINSIDPDNSLPEASNSASRRIQKIHNVRSQLKQRLTSVNNDIRFFSDNDTCPSCDQNISDDKKAEKVSNFTNTTKKIKEGISSLDSERQSAQEALDAINNSIEDCKKLNLKINELINNSEQVDKYITTLKNEIDSGQHSSIIDAEHQLEIKMQELEDNVSEREELMEKAEYSYIISEMLKDTGFKAKIIKQYLPVINKLVNHYLQVLDFFVHFDLDEEFKETIRSRHRDTFSYDSFSEGEKQRIDLSLLFTWRQVAKMKNSVSTNLLILDETFDSSLDTDGVDNLMKILNTLDDNTNVFVISHKGEMLDGKFQSKIEFKKVKNFSKMV